VVPNDTLAKSKDSQTTDVEEGDQKEKGPAEVVVT